MATIENTELFVRRLKEQNCSLKDVQNHEFVIDSKLYTDTEIDYLFGELVNDIQLIMIKDFLCQSELEGNIDKLTFPYSDGICVHIKGTEEFDYVNIKSNK